MKQEISYENQRYKEGGKKMRKHFSGQERIKILKRHLLPARQASVILKTWEKIFLNTIIIQPLFLRFPRNQHKTIIVSRQI